MSYIYIQTRNKQPSKAVRSDKRQVTTELPTGSTHATSVSFKKTWFRHWKREEERPQETRREMMIVIDK